jgi:hypothetical protein
MNDKTKLILQKGKKIEFFYKIDNLLKNDRNKNKRYQSIN